MSWRVQLKPPGKNDILECYHVLHGLANAFPIQTYLEVGVREGASLCCVLAKEPEVINFVMLCLMDGRHHLTKNTISQITQRFTPRNRDLAIYIFDNWSFKGGDGGQNRIRSLLEDGFKTSNYTIYDGDSKKGLPQFFQSHPEKVDLAFIDGDHTVEGATADLENVWEHSKIIVVHDLYHPDYQHMEKTFIDFCRRHDLPYIIFGRNRLGTGVAFNIW